MTRMVKWAVLTAFAFGTIGFDASAATQMRASAGELLQSAAHARLVDGDLTRAIELYGRIADEFAEDRPAAADALLELGACYEQLDDPMARRTYERLLREYGDQTRQTNAARTRLAGLRTEAASESNAEDVVVREVWERPQPGLSPTAGNPRFVIFNDLSVLRWNANEGKAETKRLSAISRSAAYPVLSPDQRQVAYLSWSGDLEQSLVQVRQDRSGPRSWAELRVVGVDGANDHSIYRSIDTPWLRPLAWTPDGSQILVVLDRRDGSSEMAMVSPADGSTRILKSMQGRTPGSVSFSRDGRSLAYDLPAPRDARQREFLLVQLQEDRQSNPVERRYVVNVGAEPGTASRTEPQIVHLLNRISYGPRPGDIERVKAMGVDAYIDEQLHPERIPDPLVDERLARYSSLGMDLDQLLERTGPVAPAGARARASIFEKKEMAMRRARGETRPLDNNALSPESYLSRQILMEGRPEDNEIQNARILRAVYSRRQLQEVVVDFWMNHFNINHGDHQLTAHFEEQVIRKNALGKFEDLLMAVAKHPRMLNYLDNWRSSAPEEVVKQRIEALKPSLSEPEYLEFLDRMSFLRDAKGLNENFARELMELHTLGVEGGYNQQDVIEVAKVLTGWTISGKGIVNGREDDGAFYFDPMIHVEGDKVVMGQMIPSGGVDEGEELIRRLAHHPSTARFIATKLVRRFVADDPPKPVVDEASRIFLETDGDIREVLRAIFRSAQFRSPENYLAKIKKPLELVASSLRAVDADIVANVAETPSRFVQGLGGNRGLLTRMGERLYNYEAPDGNPDVADAWMNSNALLVRLEFANDLALGKFADVKLETDEAQSFLKQLGLTPPTSEQIEQTRAMLESAAESGAADSVGMMMAGGGGAAGTANKELSDAAIAIAAMLGSPQFQKR